jgi:heptosyltransferase-3
VNPKRVLIYRLGSLGDTVVALPCFHLIARVFPEAERWVVTNHPIKSIAAPLWSILGGTDLVHAWVPYPAAIRDPRGILALARRIRSLKAEVLVYMSSAECTTRRAVRDALFFRLCGIRSMIGIPYAHDIQRHRWLADQNCYEPEAMRLSRSLATLGDARLKDPASWDLRLIPQELSRAQEFLRHWPGRANFVAFSIGTKFDTNDWGTSKWHELLSRLANSFRGLGLVMIGSAEEHERSAQISAGWNGPVLNLCGRVSPREAAAVLGQAAAFMGHDSGPMHLAAAMGVRCAVVFSARWKPRIWFPWGNGHHVVYHRMPCWGCRLERCVELKKACIESITVDEAYAAAEGVIEQGLRARRTTAS